MSGSAAKVLITERQQEVLRKLSTATTVAKRLVQRATIILLAFAGMTNQDIAKRVGLERHQIGIWRRRWQQAFNNLVCIECTEDAPAKLRHAIEELLADEPRPGSPGKFTTEQITLLFARLASRHRSPVCLLPTGPVPNWLRRPSNATSSSRSRFPRSTACSARPNCSRIAAVTG